ncbi:efflux RND transporter periplasmic adaptor subunit [Chitinimonas arctica]|uniref:Efflux RND transporter periplasmic adaptor subunit n=1 Tax=Chitinimonas arctica TaxID=2594795 RepID=A0A516SIE0_9NEIS|nr:efflux RND transporter periplasmic adaptor subunit [Chitinimonas arctica]QDQ27906.1 efflux RND transporter periplasmic adaptor subunit [Chitinimonas arctica]
MKNRHRLGLAAITVILLAGGAVLVKPKAASDTAPKVDRAALTVSATRPYTADWPLVLQASGPLAAWQEASISAELGGLQITALHADVGSRVKRGQLLAELAGESGAAAVRQAVANVEQAAAALRLARANARRGEAVKDSGVLTKQQIEQYQIAEQSAVAAMAGAEAALSSARIQLARTRIVAVDDGIVTSRSVVLGAVVGSGSELFRLLRQGRLEWRAEIGAQQLSRLKPGQMATIGLPGDGQVSGTVRQLAPTLSNENRTAIAYVDLADHADAKAGMYVRGTITLGRRSAQILPASAVTLRDGHGYVFELDSPGRDSPRRDSPGQTSQRKVIQRQVGVGRSQAGEVEIVSGLAADALVVRSGGAFLSDGDTVRLSTQETP